MFSLFKAIYLLKKSNKKSFYLTYLLVFLYAFIQVHSQSEHTEFLPIAERGLSSSYVRCFLKDSQGYMWIGTSDGLIRYDGFRIYRYEHNPDNNKSIVDNNINTIIEDSNNQLWIGTAQGLSLYNREKDNFIDINLIPENKNHLNNIYITSLAFDDLDNLWIGTHGGGINIYDPTNFIFHYISGYEVHSSLLSENYITDLLYVDGLMWCATMEGIKILNPENQSIISPKFTEDGFPAKQISKLVKAKNGSIFFSTLDGEIINVKSDEGYYSLESKFSKEKIKETKSGSILTFSTDEKGNFWIGGENFGLHYFDVKNSKDIYYGIENSNLKKIPTNSVRSVYVDDAGLIWIGTFSKGVYLVNDDSGKFRNYKLGNFKQSDLDGKDVRAFVEDKSGNVLLAYDGVGLLKLDHNTNSLTGFDQINKKLKTKVITALTFNDENTIWIGTNNEGAFNLNIQDGSIKKFKLESGGFGDNKVNLIYIDSKGTVWCGTHGSGLFYLDSKKQVFVNLFEKTKPVHITKNAYVSSLFEDSQGFLWVGTFYGLFRLSEIEDKSYKYQIYGKDISLADVYGKDRLGNEDILMGPLNANSVQAINQDLNNNLWIGTVDGGVNVKMHGTNEFKSYKKNDGLPSNTIRSILVDSIGNIWISGNMGLSKFNTDQNKFVKYDKSDGLNSNNFNNGSLVSSNGKLFFGSNDGFSTFFPDNIQRKLQKPVVHLTNLRINNESVEIDAPGSPLNKHIDLASSIELKYNQRSFAIDYIGIRYGQDLFLNNYCYMLEGFDEDWNCMGSRLSATYTNLDPGHYIFLVKASNKDGVWSDTKRLEMTILPQLWGTWWAILIYILLFAIIFFFLFKIRIERVRMKNQLSMERLAREQEHELSESKTHFFTNISHEFRTPLSLINMPIESLIAMDGLPNSVKEKINTIKQSSDKMMRLVNELMDFNKLESAKLKLHVQHGELVKFITDITSIFNDVAKKRNIYFGIHTMISSLEGWFDNDKLEKIIINILSNAFKFTSDKGQINIIINSKEAIIGDMQEKTRCLELSIVDNGIGISEEELPFIFDKFYQAKSSSMVANSGTGIGLSLTKGLVELHHGIIKVVSKPNQETVFVIIIPIDKHTYVDDDISEISECIDSSQTINHIETAIKNKIEVWDENENNDKPQILIVEDNDELRRYLSVELKNQFHVLEANNGKEGLEMALELSPDLIISDILMPIKNGIELCQDIKNNIKTSHIPIILLTARTTVEDQITGIETGADVYITKPFSIRFLIVQVNQIIETRQKLYSQFSKDVYLIPNKMAQNNIDQAFLQKAIDYITDNLQNSQLGVNSIADLFKLSRMQVYRKIKALTGKSVVNFIRMVRIKEALKLMDDQNYTLTEIAFKTGFNSASYFTTCFKEEYGKAPSEYLEENVKS